MGHTLLRGAKIRITADFSLKNHAVKIWKEFLTAVRKEKSKEPLSQAPDSEVKEKSPELTQPARSAIRNWRKRIWQHPEGIKYSSQLPISKIPAEYTH